MGDYPKTTPLRLSIAAKIAFPDGSMGAPGLRKERDAGRLVTELIAGKEYVTLAAIEEMRARCRGLRKGRASHGEARAERLTDRSAVKLDGLSETEQSLLSLAAAKETVRALKAKGR